VEETRVDSRVSWQTAWLVLAILSVSYGSPLLIVVGMKTIQESLGIDRSVVVAQLNSLSRVLSAEAFQIEMVAAERVFNKSFSSRLARMALTLQRFAKELNAMHTEAARQRFPGD